MIQILRAYDIPELLTTAIDNIYSRTKAKIISPDGETDYFDILADVLQGDTLAPYLFIIVLDYAMRQAMQGSEDNLGLTIHKRRCRRFLATVVTDRDCANDIALLCDEFNKGQELLAYVEREVALVGLKAKGKKTKVIAYNQSTSPKIATSEGTVLEVIWDFKYLGSWVDNTEKDVKTRKALAWQACNSMTKVWKSSLPKSLKSRFFEATVESVLNVRVWIMHTNS